ncbi:MAG TPA: hypothetical protein PK760_07095, partial [Flavobacteriales bacterium]|nr:hypothetical protein [Flavobacteriales bacterium]
DNTLRLQGSVINLPREGYLQVSSACMSVQNCFWFFDQRELSVIRVDAQLRKLANSGRLDQHLGFAPQPTSLQEQESRLYVNDPAQGILVFDLFGTYVRTIPITGIRSFEVRGERLWFLDAKGLKVYDMRSFATVDVPMEGDMTAVLDVRVDRGMYYMLTAERIIVRPLPIATEER